MLAAGCILAVLLILVGAAQAQTGAVAPGPEGETGAVNVGSTLPGISKTLKARVISWDIGFNPATGAHLAIG